jgi:hypothetical protein
MPVVQPVPQIQYVPQGQTELYGQAASHGPPVTASQPAPMPPSTPGTQPAPTNHTPTPQSPVSVKSPERDLIDEEEEIVDWVYLRIAPLREHRNYCRFLGRPCN